MICEADQYGRVELKPIAARYVEMPEAVAAGCERMVHPSVVAPQERRRQSRFIGLMLSAPFLVGGAAVALVTSGIGAGLTVTVIFAAFGLCWLAALQVAANGRMAVAGAGALAAGAVAVAGLVAAAGGLASPAALVLLALPFEAWWINGTRRAALWGGVMGLLAAVAQPLLSSMFFEGGAGVSALYWLLPLAWALTLVPRLSRIVETDDERAEFPDDRLEDVIDAVVLRMGKQGEVTEASAKARTLLRLAPELLTGNGLFERVHLADRIAYLSAVADMREGAPARSVELRIRLPQDGAGATADNYRPFSVEFTASASHDGAFVAVLRGNGEVAHLREALVEAREKAAGADVAKGHFLAAVSHELRTPLNAIIGFSDMLLHEMFGKFADPRQKEYVELVRDSGRHLLEVVTSILDVSRIESGAYAAVPEPFRFVEAVEMCHSMMQLQAEQKNIAFGTHIAADAGEINADRRAVQQILINLVSNAIKFTPEGGEVVIGAKRLGSRLHFWVKDTGIGIAEEDFCKLGKPFTQVHNDYTRRFEGTGLGLSLVKGLVALHDGTMSIDSAPGEGTTVTVSLPVDGPKGGRSKEKSQVLPLPAARPKEEKDGPFRKTA